ncbi:hypothetical protein DP939_27105 [Spongiactinospora rosea]|uniref:NACHT domain-containing protein n=2 Tax=Spongiactinospora rosea TaxID=2248750 RepID=A0A366LTS0_9ACTN|nr:hypothetical protein DP939_27105 [Spongiactinospora rosea]
MDLDKAADALAALVERQWRAEARRRLLGDPEPIPVHWKPVGDQQAMSPPDLVSPKRARLTARSDDMPELARLFRNLTRRRLIITGGPGTGKTTLAVQLLLHLLSTRAEDKASAGPGETVPVPVLIPISGWDPAVHPQLHDWLAVRLAQDYPALTAPEHGPDAPAALAHGGHILAVLDGLDEIGPEARTEVIKALNASLDGRDQLIVTSRSAEFGDAVARTGRPLTGALVIAPERVPAKVGADYLRDCLAGTPSEAWSRVLTALDDQPAPGLVAIAATPLGLWLIRAVYLNTGVDPAPLAGPLGQDPEALHAHLLDRLIPALIAGRPPSTERADHFRPSRPLDPDAVRKYLGFLARRFDPQATRDIVWWRLARTSRWFPLTVALATLLTSMALSAVSFGVCGAIMYAVASGPHAAGIGMRSGLTTGTPLGTMLGLAFGSAAGLSAVPMAGNRVPAGRARSFIRRAGRGLLPGGAFGVPFGLWAVNASGSPSIGALFGLTGGFAIMVAAGGAWVEQVPGYAGLRRRGRPAPGPLWHRMRRAMSRGLAPGVLCGLIFGLSGGFRVGVQYILVAGICFGLAFGPMIGLIRWVERPLVTALGTPLTSYRADRALTLLRACLTGLLFGLAIGLVLALWPAFRQTALLAGLATEARVVIGLVFGFTLGFVFGFMFGLVAGNHHAWLVLTYTAVPSALLRRLPWRFMGFLDDAHRLGLLRAVGPVYQFRHAALHDHLAGARYGGA